MISADDQTIPICRLCLTSSTPSTMSMGDEIFRARLNAVSYFSFEDRDHLPSSVCSACANKIDQFYTFIEKVRCNQEQLRLSYPFSSIQIKNEILPEESEPLVKDEPSTEKSFETINMEVEMFEYPLTAEESEQEETPPPPLIVEVEEQNEITDEDRLITNFFSLKCDACSESFESFKQLSSHAKKVHKKHPELQCCNKVFSYKHKIIYHINTHLKPCKCEECGKGFPNKHTLKVHQRAMHSSVKETDFKCDKCMRSFQTEQILRTHLRSHERVECPICKKSLSNEYTLKYHTTKVHNNERNFTCDVCGKGFKSGETLKSHSMVHKGIKREDGARCEICHAWISRKKQLRRHIIEIHQAQKVSCDICHKVYPNVKSLVTHKGRVHVENKFECEICGKRFKRCVNLKEHRASHTGQKLYSCEFCGMEMNSNGNLYSHKKNKHPEEWMQAKLKAAKFTD